jgi:hypothetical protein
VTKAVKVTRTGNSRALPVPAELANSAHIEVGDAFTVEQRDSDLIYRRNPAKVLIVGWGRSRVAITPRGEALASPGRSAIGGHDSWDF